MASSSRPTSPHLTIYRPQISTVLSIAHRITGVGLYIGLILFAYWLWTAAYNPTGYTSLHECLSSWIGRIFLFGWTFAFFYHFANGIRHLFWDIGKGFELPVMARTGWAAVFFAILMTGFVWGFIFAGGN